MYTKSFILSMVLLFGALSFTANAADWYPLPNTGQTLCYDVAGDIIACPAKGEALYGQDAQYAGRAQDFQDNGDNTVTDLNTTLMWQDSDDGLRNWEDAVDYCAVLTLGTYDDWRLPEIIELQSIADYGGVSPTINPIFSCQPSYYWSATTYTSSPAPAWVINFGYGFVTTASKVDTYYVRCVRAGRSPGSFDLSVILAGNGNGAVNFTPPGETCTTSCSKNYSTGTEITLTAAADVSSSFSGWSGGGCSGTGNCVVTVDQAMDVTATFTLHSYTLTYTADANGSINGTSPQVILHGSDGSSVTAEPGEGYHFVQWSDGSTSNPRTDTNVTAHITVSASFAINPYTLTYTADDANGSINGSSPQVVLHGSDGSSVTAEPGVGYHFVQWSDGSTSNPRTDTNVTAHITVSASFAINPYTLTYTADDANGSINGTSPQVVLHGSDGSSVTAEPGAGYHFVQWSDGSTSNPRTDTNVTAHITVSASFAINPYTLTYTADDANGSINGTSPQVVLHGSDGSSVTAEPGVGYHFVQWSDGSTSNPRTDTNVTAHITVSASFAINPYTLTYTADDANGSINGTSPQVVLHGSDGSSVTAEPGVGYHFVQWSDGSTSNPRTDTNVTAHITVSASFAINPYTLTYTADDANGSINGTSPQVVLHGSDGSSVTAEPGVGYHFVQWSDGSIANPRTDTNVTAHINVSASFAINPYTLTYTVENVGEPESTPFYHGFIDGDNQQTVNHGSNGSSVTAEPNDPSNYRFLDWSDGSTANPRTDSNVTSDITVEASFEFFHTLTYTAGSNGSIAGELVQQITPGNDGSSVTATPDAGYAFSVWSDDREDNPRTDSNVISDITVTAIFAEPIP